MLVFSLDGSNKPVQGNRYTLTFVTSEDLDQSEHLHSLLRIHTVHKLLIR